MRFIQALSLSLLLTLSMTVLAVAQSSHQGPGYLAAIPADGGTPQTLVKVSGWKCGTARWSPDGKWIAYDQMPVKGSNVFAQSTVMVAKADGTQPVSIGLGGMATWSPDSKSLAWHSYSPGAIVVASVEQAVQGKSSGVEQVADHWGNPTWLKNPRYIVSIRSSSLVRCDLQTGQETIFYKNNNRLDRGYSISPTDDRVVFPTSQGGDLILATVDPNLNIAERMLVQGGAAYSSWAPDGKRIVFSWKPKGQSRAQLYTLKVDADEDGTQQKPQRIEGQDPESDSVDPDWSADGKQILYTIKPQEIRDDDQ